jgi:selenoprotein W-related protein
VNSEHRKLQRELQTENCQLQTDNYLRVMKPAITIEYCPKCQWMLRAAYVAQEFLTTFDGELKSVTLQPSEVNGRFQIRVEDQVAFDRKQNGGFADTKIYKQLVRDIVAPGKSLGHSDIT